MLSKLEANRGGILCSVHNVSCSVSRNQPVEELGINLSDLRDDETAVGFLSTGGISCLYDTARYK